MNIEIMKFLETVGLALILFGIYHVVMKVSKKAIERREAEQEEKDKRKAAQRQRMREILEEKKTQNADPEEAVKNEEE